MKVYLDVCCLNRPFDDGAQPRVAIEAASITRLLQMIDDLQLSDYSSEMEQIEIERIPSLDRRRKVTALLPPEDRIIPLSDGLLDAADELVILGFELADAVHIAAARKVGVDAFLTVDDKLLKRAKKFSRQLGVRVTDPISFVREFEDDDYN